MCQYQTLFYDDKVGYVIRCLHCENFQVGYGNVLINLYTPDFCDFVQWIKDCRIDDYSATDPSIKSIIIPTPCDGLKLFLSQRELKRITRHARYSRFRMAIPGNDSTFFPINRPNHQYTPNRL
ncbi:DUF6686 family protein [Paraflavitalea speifideaquila]|uniref:DUF6686 family protein n=1 Tax=Paraflavitalea speifideaquila TaxID=3076558 RepID=UPI0028E9531A|nr:DUF6686 family protein [Paraflavitalea speifideiaquila]